MFFGDSLLQVGSLSLVRKNFGKASSGLALVLFLSSLVQVSLGTAQEQVLSIPRLSTPLINLKFPFSPQYVPQEFLIIQYLTPFSSPQPVTLMS